MKVDAQRFEVRLARDESEIRAAQRLRYTVFVEEMGASASPESHELRLERDRFDPFFDHLLLIDRQRPGVDGANVVGVYRLLRGKVADAGPGFYGQSEYDLTPLASLGRETVELGRSCVHPDYRGGVAMHLLWSGLGEYVIRHDVEVLFGVASFPGTDLGALALPLSHLHHSHLAPKELRVRALQDHYVEMNLMPADQIEPRQAMRQMPPLIKAYLRLGGVVGEGAFIDHDFNTIDVCLLMDTVAMTDRYKDMYTRSAGRGTT